ncbi:ABC transporter ATP-binding protein [Candidatus Clostridium stratigraminis]|uniref:ABC transporter ATP-binding protein n=1 Tax=Candidatus Clostridium stratigraminis TaxID=3381661 RepID=A0ABW8T7M7_9CLOT
MNPIIKTHEVCRNFKVGNETIHAVKNISLEIAKGSLTILRGRSGSGKTTLINLLGLIDNPNSGEISIFDKETVSLKEEERNLTRQSLFGFVFQTGALIPNMTVYENVELILRLNGISKKERKIRVERCIDYVGLSKKFNHYPEELSGGELQRIGIARAIVHKPKIILADEPTSALDFHTGLKMIKIFKEIIEKEDITIILTTHDPKLIPAADIVYDLKDGELVNE